MSFPPLPPGTTVLRVVNRTESHFPPGSREPLPAAFYPSSGDKREAIERGCPEMISVWDASRTTAVEARLLCHKTDPKEATVVSLAVDAIREIRIPEGPDRRLDVVEDPLPRERGPGAEGHCGLVGLGREPGEPRRLRTLLADMLCAACVLVD